MNIEENDPKEFSDAELVGALDEAVRAGRRPVAMVEMVERFRNEVNRGRPLLSFARRVGEDLYREWVIEGKCV